MALSTKIRIRLLLILLLSAVGLSPAQWIQTNGPYGGSITSFAGGSGTNLFAGTSGGGVFLSHGTGWTAVNTGLTNTAVTCLAISPASAGSSAYLFAGTADGGVFRSINNGGNWTEANNGLLKTSYDSTHYVYVTALAICPSSAGGRVSSLVVGTLGFGVFLSTDNGASWTASSNGLPEHVSVQAFAVSPNGAGGTNLFAGTDPYGVFLSTDNGGSWTAVNTGLPKYTRVISLAVYSTNPPRASTTLLAGTIEEGLLVSTNNGTNWTAINNGLPVSYSDNYGPHYFDISSTFVLGANLSNGTPYLFAGTSGAGVFLSTDNGISWTSANTGLTNTFVSAFAVSGMNLFAGTSGGGVFLSVNNGTTWSAVNDGLRNAYAKALVASTATDRSDGMNLFAGTGAGVFLTTDNGISWTSVNNGLTGSYVNAFAVSPASGGVATNLFASTSGGYLNSGGDIFLSTNNGISWTAANTGLGSGSVYALAVSTGTGGSETNLFAGIWYGGVYRSTNNGTSWTDAGLQASQISALAVSPASNGAVTTNLFAGTPMEGVFLSTNNGASWTASSNGLPKDPSDSTRYQMINTFGVSPTSGAGGARKLFAGTSAGVFLTIDNGTSWSAVNSGLTSTYVNAFAFSGANLFAGTWAGVFLSTNNGTNWSAISYGLPKQARDNTQDISIDALVVSGATLFAGTEDRGVWSRPLTELVSVQHASSDLPTMYSLEQNYPNPFNPSTTIRFGLPTRSRVRLVIYNILGQEITELVNQDLNAGYFEKLWYANVASGLYFYRIEAVSLSDQNKRYVDVKKMILLK